MGLMLACPLFSWAQDKGMWHAASSTAKAITGDVAISDVKLEINFISFPLAQIRKLDPAEASAAFDTVAGAGASGNLYRLRIPDGQRFLHHNTLCGSEETQWMVTYAQGRSLQVAFFSGPNVPVLTAEALTNSTDVCGTFSYVR